MPLIILTLLLLVNSQAVFASPKVNPQTIRIFHSNNLPEPSSQYQSRNINIEIYDLSNVKKLLSHLSYNLSDDPKFAEIQAKNRIDSIIYKLKQQFRVMIEAEKLIERFGIKRFPAAVVDEKLVFYNWQNLEQIIDAWQRIK